MTKIRTLSWKKKSLIAFMLLVSVAIAFPATAFAEGLKEDTYSGNTLTSVWAPDKVLSISYILEKTECSDIDPILASIDVKFTDEEKAKKEGKTVNDYVRFDNFSGIRFINATEGSGLVLKVTVDDGVNPSKDFKLAIEKATISFSSPGQTVPYGTDFLSMINADLGSYCTIDNGEIISSIPSPSRPLFQYKSDYVTKNVYLKSGSSVLAAIEPMPDVLTPNRKFDNKSNLVRIDSLQPGVTPIVRSGVLEDMGSWMRIWTPRASEVLSYVEAGEVAFVDGSVPPVDDSYPELSYDGKDPLSFSSSVNLPSSYKGEKAVINVRNKATNQLYKNHRVLVCLDDNAPVRNENANGEKESLKALAGKSKLVNDCLFVGTDGRIRLYFFDYADPDGKKPGSGLTKENTSVLWRGQPIFNFEVSQNTNKGKEAEYFVDITLPESEVPYFLSEMIISVRDRAGNNSKTYRLSEFSEKISSLVVNESQPQVTVEFDNNSPFNEQYYNAARTASIKLYDPNGESSGDLDYKVVDYSFTVDGVNTSTKTIMKSDMEPISPTDKNNYVLEVPCRDNGSYQFTEVENTGEFLSNFSPILMDPPDPFVIDTEVPKLTGFSWAQPMNTYEDIAVYNDSESASLSATFADEQLTSGIVQSSITESGNEVVSESSIIPESTKTISGTLTRSDVFIPFESIALYVQDASGNDVSKTADVAYAKLVEEAVNPEEMATAPKGFLVDSTAPRLSISQEVEPVEGIYYNQDPIIRLTVVEESFGLIREVEPWRTFAVKSVDSFQQTIHAKDFSNPSGDGVTWIYDMKCDRDGAYDIDFSVTDIANKTTTLDTMSFVVDATAPSISAVWDNNSSAGGGYFNAPRTLTLTVRDMNINPATSIALNTNGAVGGWRQVDTDTYETHVSCSGDGHYQVTVSVVDFAHNTTEPYDSGEFVIDTVAPQIVISGVADRTAYAGQVMPRVEFSDTNYASFQSNVEIIPSMRENVYFSHNREATETQEVLSYDDFAYDLSKDDIYTLVAETEDLAGNSASQAVTFSVNRFGSNYVLSDETKKFLNGFISSPEPVQFKEINVSGLNNEQTSVSLSQNDRIHTLTDTEYTCVREPGTTWAEYTYTIWPQTMTTDGYYRVLVHSEDIAGNMSENLMENKNETRDGASPVQFALDSTKPLVNIFDLDNKEPYLMPMRRVFIDIKDNLQIENARVLVNDQEVATFNEEQIRNEETYVELEAKDISQSVLVEGVDKAGNVGRYAIDKVVVTDNALVYWLNSPKLFYPSIAACIVLLSGIALTIVLRGYSRSRAAAAVAAQKQAEKVENRVRNMR